RLDLLRRHRDPGSARNASRAPGSLRGLDIRASRATDHDGGTGIGLVSRAEVARGIARHPYTGGPAGRVRDGQGHSGSAGRGGFRRPSQPLCRNAVFPFDQEEIPPLKELLMHRVVTREQWIAERKKLLVEEKEFTRRRDALGEKRRALPWVR